MITKECYLRKLEITRGFNAPCIVLIIGKVLIKYILFDFWVIIQKNKNLYFKPNQNKHLKQSKLKSFPMESYKT